MSPMSASSIVSSVMDNDVALTVETPTIKREAIEQPESGRERRSTVKRESSRDFEQSKSKRSRSFIHEDASRTGAINLSAVVPIAGPGHGPERLVRQPQDAEDNNFMPDRGTMQPEENAEQEMDSMRTRVEELSRAVETKDTEIIAAAQQSEHSIAALSLQIQDLREKIRVSNRALRECVLGLDMLESKSREENAGSEKTIADTRRQLTDQEKDFDKLKTLQRKTIAKMSKLEDNMLLVSSEREGLTRQNQKLVDQRAQLQEKIQKIELCQLSFREVKKQAETAILKRHTDEVYGKNKVIEDLLAVVETQKIRIDRFKIKKDKHIATRNKKKELEKDIAGMYHHYDELHAKNQKLCKKLKSVAKASAWGTLDDGYVDALKVFEGIPLSELSEYKAEE